MLVSDVLKTKVGGVIRIGAEATVADAVARLVEHNIGSLPVVDADGRLVGIFTERDVLRGVHLDCEQFYRRKVAEVMTPEPVTCDLQDDVQTVMGKMSEHQVGQLPVLGEFALVGIVSVGDVIKTLYRRLEAENRHLLDYLYGPV